MSDIVKTFDVLQRPLMECYVYVDLPQGPRYAIFFPDPVGSWWGSTKEQMEEIAKEHKVRLVYVELKNGR